MKFPRNCPGPRPNVQVFIFHGVRLSQSLSVCQTLFRAIRPAG